MIDTDYPVIQGWQCPVCRMIYNSSGVCRTCAQYLKPIVEQIPE